MNDRLELICEKCAKSETVSLAAELRCKQCGAMLTGKKYIKKPWVRIPFLASAVSGIILGIVGSVVVYNKFETNRYPVSVEYSEIQTCISPLHEPLKKPGAGNRQEICICALNETMKTVDYDLYQKDRDLFMAVFQQKANEGCN